MRVPTDPTAIGVIRHAVTTAVEPCGPETAEIVSLIFTELVTNAILHAGQTPDDPIDVTWELSANGVTGRVSDNGPGFELVSGPQPRADGGFGLFIVERLARRWGTEKEPGRNTVWFHL